MQKKLAPVVKRDGSVMLGNEKIGSVRPMFPMYMVYLADGTPKLHMFWQTRKAAVEYLYHRHTKFIHA